MGRRVQFTLKAMLVAVSLLCVSLAGWRILTPTIVVKQGPDGKAIASGRFIAWQGTGEFTVIVFRTPPHGDAYLFWEHDCQQANEKLLRLFTFSTRLRSVTEPGRYDVLLRTRNGQKAWTVAGDSSLPVCHDESILLRP